MSSIRKTATRPVQAVLCSFAFSIDDKWYIHGPLKEGDMIPTEFAFDDQARIRIKDLIFPITENLKFGLPLRACCPFFRADPRERDLDPPGGYFSGGTCPQGETLLSGLFSGFMSAAGKPLPVHILVRGSAGFRNQAINQEVFLAHEKGIKADVRIGAGLWLTLLGFFFGAWPSNLTPCIYPLIPITVSYFGGREQGRGATATHAFLYLVGLAVMNFRPGGVGLLVRPDGRLSAAAPGGSCFHGRALFVAFATSSFGSGSFGLRSG